MPPKIKSLIKNLELAGFKNRGGKGSHRNHKHVKGVSITVSGKSSDDAKHYQVREVEKAIELVSDEKK